MSAFKEYTDYDGLGLAELVRKRAVSAGELLDCALAALEAVNGRLNCVVSVLEDRARQAIAAGLPEGPFTGVPFLIKECMLMMEGAPYRYGTRLLEGFTAPLDSELMKRCRASGLVTFGTTPMPEGGYSPTTESVFYGKTHNPWNTAHSPGGSSGGSAAAVAAGVVPFAHANDGGGSIRIPAACCGLVGLKPSLHRVPQGPLFGESLQGMAVELAVSRTVRDTAAALDAVAGPDPGARVVIQPPEQPYLQAIATPPGRLRIALMDHSFSGTKVDAEILETVRAVGALCAELGHEVVVAAPRFDWEAFFDATHVIWAVNATAGFDAFGEAVGRAPSPQLLEAVTWACYEDGKRHSGPKVIEALGIFNLISRVVGQFFTEYDVLLTPTLARLPVPLGEIDQNNPALSARDWSVQVFDWCNFTPLFNTTGQPAISLPLGQSAGGLPIGVQFAGRVGDETTLLKLARQLEEARPWRDRRPGVFAA